MEFIYKYTSELTSKEIDSFYNVLYEESRINKIDFLKKFDNKFKKNIFGDSLHVFAFHDGKCVGTQSFQRNDINNTIAYQSCESVVIPEYKRKGIFSKMVLTGTNNLPKEAIIYGFPNNNSLNAFLKLGWTFNYRNKYSVYIDYNEIPEIEEDYLNWIIGCNPNIFLKRIGNYFLILKKRKYNIYVVYAKIKVDKTSYTRYSKPVLPIILEYSKNGIIGNGMVLVTKNILDDNIVIPNYKMDTLLY